MKKTFTLIIQLLFVLTQSVVAQSDHKSVIFILSDDHRYDFMGFMNKVPFLETPNMDRMAAEGAHIKNARI